MRTVCALAKVTAPTLYHHFGSADGLLNAAVAEAFEQFLARKKVAAAAQWPDAATALRQGWDDYVRFAAERPRLYAAMTARMLQGGDIPAARQAYALLVERIETLAAEGRLAMAVQDAAQTAWASAHAAAFLHVTAAMLAAAPTTPPIPPSSMDCAIARCPPSANPIRGEYGYENSRYWRFRVSRRASDSKAREWWA